MKIARFEHQGITAFGLWSEESIQPCAGDPFSGLEPTGPPLPLDRVRLLAPVEPPNIIAIGLNYRRHAAEAKMELPGRPLFFIKATTSLNHPEAPILLPGHDPDRIDYEAELALVIGRRAQRVSPGEAMDHVLGCTVANDVSNRRAQGLDGQWARAKSYDTFCPLGPVLVTDLDPSDLAITCCLDGQVMQSSRTSDMIFPCPELVSYLSHCMTLLPGTVILTGTPEGVGFARKPPVYLQAGQVVECQVEGIGVLRNIVAG